METQSGECFSDSSTPLLALLLVTIPQNQSTQMYGLSVFDATAKRKQSSILQTKLSKFGFFELVVGVGSKNMEFKCQLHCTKHFNLKQIKSYRSEKVIKRKVLTFNLSIEVYFLLFSRRTFSVQKNFYYKV